MFYAVLATGVLTGCVLFGLMLCFFKLLLWFDVFVLGFGFVNYV